MRFRLLSCLLSLTFALPAFAQYSETAGMNSAPAARVIEQVRNDKTGKMETRERFVPVVRDSYGNSGGNQHDLAVDGAFDGQTVAVVQLYDFPFDAVRDALKEKGFSVFRWNHGVPPAKEFEKQLAKACQLWIISSDTRQLSDEHIAVIKRFFDSGKGVYMRSLARDLARAVGTVGHIAALRRLRVGPFAEAMAISLDKAVPPDDNAPALGPLLAVETALADIPALALTEAEASPLKDGQAISLIPLLGRIPAAANPDGGLVRAVAGGRAVALGRLQDGMLHPVRLLVPGAQAPSP